MEGIHASLPLPFWLMSVTGSGILLIGYLYGVSSERKWWSSCACIWRGAGLPDLFDQEIPHHYTFSKSRHGRFQESKILRAHLKQLISHLLEQVC
jgi:hypothetical protein